MDFMKTTVGAPTGLRDASRFSKHMMTWAVYYCTFAFGCGYTFIGPCAIDFSNKFDVEMSTLSVVFTILTGSYLCGALACGVLFNFINRQKVVLFLLFPCMAAALFIIPNVNSLAVFFVLNFLLGFGAGGYDCAQIAWIIDIWRSEASPFILAQHFAYSVGTIVPPLILGPFLKGEEEKDNDQTTTTTTPATTEISSSTIDPMADSKLWIPFSVAGCIVLVAIVIQFILFFTLKNNEQENTSEIDKEKANNKIPKDSLSPSSRKNSTDYPEIINNNDIQSKDPSVEGSGWSKTKILLLFLSCCVISSYQGMELTTMQFLPTFSVYSEVALTEQAGAQILFWLTLAFAVGRGIGIIIVLKLPPHFILLGNFVLLLAANLILLLVAQSNLWMLRIGSILMGLALSTVFPGYYAYIERHLFVSDTIAAVITVSGGLVSAIYPLIVGNSVETNPSILIYVNLFSCFILFSSFGFTYYKTMVQNRKSK